MNRNWKTSAVVVASVLATASTALAQQPQGKDEPTTASVSEDRLAPATHSLELTIGTGYEQGFGNIASHRPSLTDVGEAGGAVQAGVGYRVLPQLTLGVFGSFAEFGRGAQVDSTANLYSAAAGVQADWHFLPSHSELDPWVSLGTGWRGYWIVANQATTSMQGLELGRLQVGVDYRIDRAVSLSPVVGAGLSTLLTQSNPQATGYENIPSPNVNTFFFAGLQGRFDIATDSGRTQVASR